MIRRFDLIEPWPWECRVCRDWDDQERRWHVGGCWNCNDTGIAWAWLREFKWRWAAFSWYRLRPIRRWLYHRCDDCHKPDRILGFWIWSWHKDCIPF